MNKLVSGLIVLIVIAIAASLLAGRVWLPPSAFLSSPDSLAGLIIHDVRLPRTVLALITGAVLALSGAVLLCVANTLTMSAQLALTGPLRARGMAIYQMSIMGGSAGGAALWGAVAAKTSVAAALLGSAAVAVALLAWTRRISVE